MKSKYIIFTTLLLAACTKGGEKNSLADKKTELTKLKTEQADLGTKIKKIEGEIAKLDTSARDEIKIKNVAVSPIASQKFQHFVEVQGSLDAVNNALISPQTGGALTKVLVKEGDYVKTGQLIATIDNSILTQSKQEIEVQMQLAQTLFEKQKALWEQKIGTEVQFIQAKTNVESLQKRLATLDKQTALSKVVAPWGGYVDEVRQKSGEMASPGMGIIRLVNLDNLKVVAKVADTYAGTIQKGDLVKIKFPDLNKDITANITFVSQTVALDSRTFKIEANIPNIGGQLKPNMTAIVNINDQSKSSALVIEQNLVQHTEDGDIVMVAVSENNKKIARSRKVKTGLIYNGNIEISSGLRAGDMLITQGYQELVDGQLVNY